MTRLSAIMFEVIKIILVTSKDSLYFAVIFGYSLYTML